MAWDRTRLVVKALPVILSFLFTQLSHYILSLTHRITYKSIPNPLNIVIIGGSFTGYHLAKRLSQSLPTGYRVILIEKNSHFNYTFNFPRYSVLKGREQKAFIPYSGLEKGCPKGALEIVRGTVTEVEDGRVRVMTEKGEEKVEWEFLAIATGSTQNLPAKVKGTTKVEGRSELRGLQDKIEKARKIARVGGGAVGVQLAGDIKTWYGEKEVTLVHSRDRLLSSFGGRLGIFVGERMETLSVRVLLGERPEFKEGETSLRFKNGNVEEFDFVIRCTGQIPNSSFLTSFLPSSISSTTKRIHVKPTLQLLGSDSDSKLSINDKIFALGDVAETSGVKMARAGMEQAEIVQHNILQMVKGRTNLKDYVPNYFEGSLKLSLGKDGMVMYIQDGEEEFLIPGKGLPEDLSVKQAWWMFGVSMKDCEI